ncbi:MAG: choice-of-anchor X domain-containing protein, partial [Pseudomonadota bacterium]
ITGHKIDCLNCHNAGKNHIDHNHRTYEVTEVEADPNVIGIVVNPYCDSYRLKDIDGQPCMNIPRPGGDPIANWQDFALCFDCHNRNEVLGVASTDVSHTNFWDEYGVFYSIWFGLDYPMNAHNGHLGFTDPYSIIHADSDWDGVTYADSAESCITCHNVHGSPTKAMTRHGELISSYGTTDKVPSLNFAYRSPPDPPWATITWRPDIPEAGTYDVYAWWKASSSNVTNAKYTIYYNGGYESVEVNQQINGGQWNKLGTYSFAAGTSGYIMLSNENYDGTEEHRYIIADAIGWDSDFDGNPDIVIDDRDPGWSREGSWSYRELGGEQAYPPPLGDYYSHSILFNPDSNATLQESVGGGIYVTSSGLGKSIEENGVCNMCHIGYPGMVGYLRDPFIGPQVIMPKAEPETVSNNGSGTTLLTVYILDHDDDISNVAVDLSPIDGSSSQLMYDDGTNGDVTAGDNIFSFRVTVPDTVTAGDKSLPVTGTDSQSNTGTNTIKVTITSPG